MAERTKKRNWAIALFLSLAMAGLGHMYNGRIRKGAVLYAGLLAIDVCAGLAGIIYSFEGACAGLAVAIGLTVAIGIDAALGSIKCQEIELKPYNRWYFYAICFVVSFAISELWLDPLLFQVERFKIPSASMEPALVLGDHIVMKSRPYQDGKTPNRGEVVVFPYPKDPTKTFINRIVALEGEKLEIRNKALYINDKELEDPWGISLSRTALSGNKVPRDNFGPIIIPDGCIFVTGDNRDFSNDSRFWGPVEIKDVQGKALYIYWAKVRQRIGKRVP
jgi:signal peptidase I